MNVKELELHNAMLDFVFRKRAMMSAFNPEFWLKFKATDGITAARPYNVIQLANIFKNEIFPNMHNYQYVRTNPAVRGYMLHKYRIKNIPNDEPIPIEFQDVTKVSIYEALAAEASAIDENEIQNPFVTTEILCLSHLVSTRTEADAGIVHCREEIQRRLGFICANKGKYPCYNPPDAIKYHQLVRRLHNLDCARLNDIQSKSSETLSEQNLPIMYLDPNMPDATQTQHSLFDASNASAVISADVDHRDRNTLQIGDMRRPTTSLPAVEESAGSDEIENTLRGATSVKPQKDPLVLSLPPTQKSSTKFRTAQAGPSTKPAGSPKTPTGSSITLTGSPKTPTGSSITLTGSSIPPIESWTPGAWSAPGASSTSGSSSTPGASVKPQKDPLVLSLPPTQKSSTKFRTAQAGPSTKPAGSPKTPTGSSITLTGSPKTPTGSSITLTGSSIPPIESWTPGAWSAPGASSTPGSSSTPDSSSIPAASPTPGAL